jgi:hypothetical protein
MQPAPELDELEVLDEPVPELLDEADSPPESGGYSPVSVVVSDEQPSTNAKIKIFFIGS